MAILVPPETLTGAVRAPVLRTDELAALWRDHAAALGLPADLVDDRLAAERAARCGQALRRADLRPRLLALEAETRRRLPAIRLVTLPDGSPAIVADPRSASRPDRHVPNDLLRAWQAARRSSCLADWHWRAGLDPTWTHDAHALAWGVARPVLTSWIGHRGLRPGRHETPEGAGMMAGRGPLAGEALEPRPRTEGHAA